MAIANAERKRIQGTLPVDSRVDNGILSADSAVLYNPACMEQIHVYEAGRLTPSVVRFLPHRRIFPMS